MKGLRVVILAAVMAGALSAPIVSGHGLGKAFAANPNGQKQNGVCQNGVIDPTTGQCINNPDNH